jgi:hypothetical protein
MKKYPLGYGIVFITQKAMMAILVVCLLACQGSTQPIHQPFCAASDFSAHVPGFVAQTDRSNSH